MDCDRILLDISIATIDADNSYSDFCDDIVDQEEMISVNKTDESHTVLVVDLIDLLAE